MDLNSIQNMAEWNLEIYLIEMRRIHLNHTPESNAGMNLSFMNGNKLKWASYIWITKMFCSHIRQRIYATISLHTNNSRCRKKGANYKCVPLKLHLNSIFFFGVIKNKKIRESYLLSCVLLFDWKYVFLIVSPIHTCRCTGLGLFISVLQL